MPCSHNCAPPKKNWRNRELDVLLSGILLLCCKVPMSPCDSFPKVRNVRISHADSDSWKGASQRPARQSLLDSERRVKQNTFVTPGMWSMPLRDILNIIFGSEIRKIDDLSAARAQ
ncbi:uncharacterized protein LAESUDRAFT_450510 [Laetiporus sulphureus 93-53]|uniref:Uncharacterized protein n=1 Tax=Laetiporus sulphureus 93-53 TaxID=1314785 RepID=A0A165BWK5_9APHY|nr:uncharacterized protein LAESUDRAFT_450510 [Laetiporus sulphureus 93-53]KZT01783.1 hypothetical protein LAESUDRAFT_450510 [Laetiporus sulphureus 93-53]